MIKWVLLCVWSERAVCEDSLKTHGQKRHLMTLVLLWGLDVIVIPLFATDLALSVHYSERFAK